MSLEISDKNKDQIITWRRLKTYKGFQLIVNELDETIKEAERVIFATGADHKPMYSDRDMAIVKRDNAMRIKDLPDRMIELLGGTGQTTPENPDAYQEVEDINDELFDDDF